MIRVLLAVLSLALCLPLAPMVAVAAGKGGPPAAVVPASEVMEWFANRRPQSGTFNTVYAQVWLKNRPVAGARLFVTVMTGRRVVQSLKGGLTDVHGKTSARFFVPKNARGKTLLVKVRLTLTNHPVLTGRNQLHVRK